MMFVATVPDKIHGAGVLAYENFMDQAAERVGGSFYIIPSKRRLIFIIPRIQEERSNPMV